MLIAFRITSPWSVHDELTACTVASASTAAFTMNAAGERSKPSRFWKSAFTLSRKRMRLVMSTSITACACGADHAWTMFAAIARRIWVRGTGVSPCSGAGRGAAAGCGRAALPAAAAGARVPFAAMNDSMSCRETRPPRPVPWTCDRSI